MIQPEDRLPHWDDWLSDSADGFYSSRSWLLLTADSEGFRDRYVVAPDRPSEPTMVLPVGVAENGTRNRLYDLACQAGRGEGGALSPPQVVLGPHSGYANEPIMSPAGQLESWVDLCRKASTEYEGWWVGIPFLRLHTAVAVQKMLPGAHLVHASGRCEVTVGDDGVEGYLSGLSRSRRSMVRRDLRSIERSRCHLEVTRLTVDLVAELAPLLVNVQRRHGNDVSLHTVEGFLGSCAASDLADDSLVFVARNGSASVAFSLYFRYRSTLVARVVGLDYAQLGPDNQYFNVLLYAPLRYAQEWRLRRIDLGTEGFRTKLVRGADYIPQATVLLRAPDSFSAAPVNDCFLVTLEQHVGDLIDVPALREVAS